MRERKPSYTLSATPPATQVTSARGGGLVASLELENPGDERVLLREVDIVDVDGACGPTGAQMRVRTPVILRPRSRRRVPIPIDLPRDTPAGTYRFDIDVGGATERVEVHVAAKSRISLSPASILVTGGGKSDHTIVIKNRGNTTATLSGTIAVPLDDELIVCRSLRGAMTVFDDRDSSEDVTLDQILTEGFRHAHAALKGAIIGVQFVGETIVGPGDQANATLKLDVPSGLDTRTRFFAAVPVLTATLGVVVVPGQLGSFDHGTSESAPPGGRKATAKQAGAAAKAPTKSTAKKSGAATKTTKKSTAKKSGAATKTTKKSTAKRRPASGD